MFPEDPSDVIQVWQWIAFVCVGAIVAQWGYMIAMQRAARQERLSIYASVNDALKENTRAIQELTIWLKSGGAA